MTFSPCAKCAPRLRAAQANHSMRVCARVHAICACACLPMCPCLWVLVSAVIPVQRGGSVIDMNVNVTAKRMKRHGGSSAAEGADTDPAAPPVLLSKLPPTGLVIGKTKPSSRVEEVRAWVDRP